MGRAVRRMVVRIGAALLAGVLLILIPLPPSEPILSGRVAIVTFLVVVYIGKTIYDTLFYNRFIP